jgi:hypothetical protein
LQETPPQILRAVKGMEFDSHHLRATSSFYLQGANIEYWIDAM